MAEQMRTQWRVVGGSSLHKTVEVFTEKKMSLHQYLVIIIIITTSTMSKQSDSPWCEPNASLFRDVFLLAFGDKKVSPIRESFVGICGSWPVQASNCHITICVFYVKKNKKCTQTSNIISCLVALITFFIQVKSVSSNRPCTDFQALSAGNYSKSKNRLFWRVSYPTPHTSLQEATWDTQKMELPFFLAAQMQQFLFLLPTLKCLTSAVNTTILAAMQAQQPVPASAPVLAPLVLIKRTLLLVKLLLKLRLKQWLLGEILMAKKQVEA